MGLVQNIMAINDTPGHTMGWKFIGSKTCCESFRGTVAVLRWVGRRRAVELPTQSYTKLLFSYRPFTNKCFIMLSGSHTASINIRTIKLAPSGVGL
jgi:hypothetical protein